jgi:putative two-component system response regulator
MSSIYEQEVTDDLLYLNPEINLPFQYGYKENTLVGNGELAIPSASILVVDDDEAIGRLINNYLNMRGISHVGASNALEALEILNQKHIDLVISDIKMERISGIELMQRVHREYPHMPFIIMTGYAPDYSYEDIINIGASDFIAKPFSMGELNAKILRIAREKKILWQLQQSLIRSKELLENTVGALASTLEKRDPYTAGHQQRVGYLACALAQEIGLPLERIEGLRLAAFVHDIGKIGVPSEILAKPGKLSEVEMNLIRVHSQVGFDILKRIDFPWPIAEMVLQHHERLNGSGYPHGLIGQKILLEAKIIGVADVFEAMNAHRPYRPALGLSLALDEIYQKKGVLYDEEIVDACIRLFTEKDFKFDSPEGFCTKF